MQNDSTAIMTMMAMLFFAANSLLCRMAIAPGHIDPISFSSVRVLAAIAVLTLVVLIWCHRLPRLSYAEPRSATALLVYLLTFPLAYERLGAGLGAIVLFAAVQLTMFAVAFYEGERFTSRALIGMAVSGTGLVFLMSPGGNAGDLIGFVLMLICGVSWGGFCLLARGSDRPVEANASNFVCCAPLLLLVNAANFQEVSLSSTGVELAIAAGGIATAVGYIAWYQAMKKLSASRAAVVQLSVPVLTVVGGVFFLSETLSIVSLVASGAILGGIGIVLSQQRRICRL